MPAPQIIQDLVDRFERNIKQYKQAQNEAQVSKEFIEPFFKALGWDVDNESGAAPQYQDIIHQDKVKVGSSSKVPDYAFRIGGTRKFYVEAKKPSVFVKEDAAPAFQVRSYGWSAKLDLSIVTDFEEFAVYECNTKPKKNDKPSVARVNYYTYKEYIDKWDEIAGVFSKASVLTGSFDRFASGAKGKRGTTTVDKAFLQEIEHWRELIAKNFAKNNNITEDELKFATQRTLDRIIFLRICEARGIEDDDKLKDAVQGANAYKNLFALFQAADNRYNSGLFYFRKGDKAHKNISELDTITPNLKLDDKILKEIINGLYYPASPYQFNVIPADILGQVYEQFLGKAIHLKNKRVTIEKKAKALKKDGGIFYTHTYIVDYIVKQTVGALIEKKKVSNVDLKIIDPACGSGSFLIGAYSYMLNWYLGEYSANANKYLKQSNAPIYEISSGNYALTTSERKRILLEHIYGVDLDQQAVEVAKLNLMLKCLEGEAGTNLKLSVERILPDLSENIKCGNSLINDDYAESELFGEGDKFKINPFNWDREFTDIMANGGFDAVIGNPPYVPLELIADSIKKYYVSHYPQLERKYDTGIIFILQGLKLLNPKGLLGYISSVTWQTGENFRKLREHLFTDVGVRYLINLPFNVFPEAYVDTGVYIMSKAKSEKYDLFRFDKKSDSKNLDNINYISIESNLVSKPDYKIVLEPNASKILNKFNADTGFISFGEITESTQGLAGNKFILESKRKNDNYFPFMAKGNCHRYVLNIIEKAYTDLSKYPTLKKYYGDDPKILIRRVISRQDRLLAAFTDRQLVFKKDINPFILTTKTHSPQSILAILNSKLISYLYINTSSIATKDDFRQTTLAELRRLPIPKSIPPQQDKALCALVDSITKLNSELLSTTIPQKTIQLERQITKTDEDIDAIVNKLYGLEKGKDFTGS